MGIQQCGIVIERIIQKSLKGLEGMEVLITSHMKVFLGNEHNSYIHTARNAKETNGRFSEAYLEPIRTSTIKLF